MIELHTEEGTKLEIYDPSCIVSMREIYGGLKGEYTSLTLNGLLCSVTVLETKRQIERMLQPEMDLFTKPTTVEVADTYTVVREKKVAGKTVDLEERYYIKTVGRGRYWE